MTNLNKIYLIGKTGASEPKLEAALTGRQSTHFTVATNQRFKDDAGAWQNKTTWHNIVAFGEVAEHATKIAPGSLVFVEGTVNSRTYSRELDTTRGTVAVEWPVVEIIVSNIGVLKKASIETRSGRE